MSGSTKIVSLCASRNCRDGNCRESPVLRRGKRCEIESHGARCGRRSRSRRARSRRSKSAGVQHGSGDLDAGRVCRAVSGPQEIRLAANHRGAWKNASARSPTTIAAADAKLEDAKRAVAEHEAKLAAAAGEVRALLDEARRDAEVTKKSIEAEGQKAAKEELDRAVREIDRPAMRRCKTSPFRAPMWRSIWLRRSFAKSSRPRRIIRSCAMRSRNLPRSRARTSRHAAARTRIAEARNRDGCHGRAACARVRQSVHGRRR